MLHYQLKETPQDFFVDIVSRDNFLVSTLHTFFLNLEETDGVPGHLRDRGMKFKAFEFNAHMNLSLLTLACRLLSKHYQWDFDEVADDEQPVLVELPNQ